MGKQGWECEQQQHRRLGYWNLYPVSVTALSEPSNCTQWWSGIQVNDEHALACTVETDLRKFLTIPQSMQFRCLMSEVILLDLTLDLCLLFFLTVSQKMSIVKRKQKRMPTSLCWMRLYLYTGGTVMRKCMQAATSIQGGESISSSLITPTLCGGPSQSTTESIILDKAGVTESESRVEQMTFNFL